jgi:hypothetical protein
MKLYLLFVGMIMVFLAESFHGDWTMQRAWQRVDRRLNELGGGHQLFCCLLYVFILILINKSVIVTLSSKKTVQYILSMTQNLCNY